MPGVQADGRVLSYSDSTVTLDWAGQLQATLGEGLPYVYFTAPNAGTAIQLVTTPKNNPDNTAVNVTIIANGTPGLLTGTGPLELEFKYMLLDGANQFSLAGNTTDKSPVVTLANTTSLAPGMTVSGAGVTPGSTILSVDSATQITLSQPGNDTISGSSLAFNSLVSVDHFYGIYLPAGVAWHLTSNTNGTLTANLGTTGYFSLATLPGPLTLTANVTAGSARILSFQDTSLLYAGMMVTGPGVPANTTIVSVNSASQVTLSNPVTATANMVVLSFTSFDDSNAFNVFEQSAYTFVTGSTSSFSIDPTTDKITTTYLLQTVVKEGNGAAPLQALNVTQYNNLTSSAGLVTDGSAAQNQYTYASPEGVMKVWNGPVFSTQLQYAGIMPQVPPLAPDGTSDAQLWFTYLLPILQGVSGGSQADGMLTLQNLLPNQNNYLQAQSMAQAPPGLVPILLEISQSTDSALSANDKAQAASYAQQIYNQVKGLMAFAWLKVYHDPAPLQMLYYQPAALQENAAPPGTQGWQSLISIAAGFLSSESLNDHQLIAGYFIKVADFLQQYDSSWGGISLQVRRASQTPPSSRKWET